MKDLICQLPTHTTPAIIAKELNLSGPNFMFSTACAAGNYAIGYGYDLIRFNRADIILAGGIRPILKNIVSQDLINFQQWLLKNANHLIKIEKA